jgi:nitroreductase
VGAALFNLRLAVRSRGRLPIVRRPDAGQAGAVARLSLGPPAAPDGAVVALAGAIGRRRTNRQPYADAPVPGDVIEELRAAAAAEGATLTVPGPAERTAILSLIRTAHNRQVTDPAYRHELEGWTRTWPGRRDGLPRKVLGPRDVQDALPVRDFAAGRGPSRPAAQFERHPTLVVLSTNGDGPDQWLRAGQALERVLLTATVRGLAAQPMTQPLEVPELRSLLAQDATGRQAQVILRVGYGKPVARSPRRRLPEVLDRPDDPAT